MIGFNIANLINVIFIMPFYISYMIQINIEPDSFYSHNIKNKTTSNNYSININQNTNDNTNDEEKYLLENTK